MRMLLTWRRQTAAAHLHLFMLLVRAMAAVMVVMMAVVRGGGRVSRRVVLVIVACMKATGMLMRCERVLEMVGATAALAVGVGMAFSLNMQRKAVVPASMG
jgi:hypothetical protein